MPRAPGDVLSVTDAEARALIGAGQAVPQDEPETPPRKRTRKLEHREDDMATTLAAR